METRSRKRAEATGRRPSPPNNASNKRPRISPSSPPLPRSIINSNKHQVYTNSITSTTTLTNTSTTTVSRLPANSTVSQLPTSFTTNTNTNTTTTSTTAAVSRFQDVSMDSPPFHSSSSTSKSAKKEAEKEKDEDLGRRTSSRMEREREAAADNKGKEKEPRAGGDKDRERGDRDGPAPSGDEEHNDVEGNSRQYNLASASSALHGLLRKLGAGFDDLLPSSSPHQSSKLKRILSGLRADGEEGRQLESLSQLCELLSIGTEESLSSFSVDSFVPVLVSLLNHEYNADMMLLAARALTHLCDVLPSSCAAVVHYGAVPCLCARLLTIEYIDLAEQSLQALDKISHEHPTACLRAGALLAVLSYLDFFSTGVQRVAVSTAANICRQLPSDASDFVMEAVPILTNLLQYQDAKVVEHASICLTRIAESFALSSEKLDTLCSHGLISQAVRLISVSASSGGSVSQTSLSNSTYTGLIRLLSTCASGSAVAAENLLLLNVSSILKDILAGSGLVASISVVPSSMNRPPEQLYELVNLVNELLPPMPQLVVPQEGPIISRNTSRRQPTSAKLEENSHSSIREKLLLDHPDILIQFGTDLFSVLIQVYGSSVNPPVRYKCLAAMSKLVHFSTADMLRSLFRDLNISSFLAGVLALKDSSIILTALQIADILMRKLPDVFMKLFVKEGVLHAIDNLIASDHGSSSSPLPLPQSVTKTGDGSGGTHEGTPPVRTRRGTRSRGSGVSTPEDLKGLSFIPVGSPPSSSGADTSAQSSKSGLRALAISTAKSFKAAHFPADSAIADVGVTESLSKLKALCAKLNGETSPGCKGKWKGKGKAGVPTSAERDEMMLAAIGEVFAELSRGDGVSTFEFVGSGIIVALLNFFSGGSQCKENLTDAGLRQQALGRLKQFVMLGIPSSIDGKEAPITVLVRKLQNALASLERFPVILSHAPRSGTGNASVASGLSALAHPFKLRLCRVPGERGLRDYSSNIVLIDPLATLSSIEDFLWPRVQRSDSSHKSSAVSNSEGASAPSTTSPPTSTPPTTRPSTRSRSSAPRSSETPPGTRKEMETAGNTSSSKGKGKMGARSPDETKGPETRNAAARRRAAAVAACVAVSKQSHGDSVAPFGSEDDDAEVSPVELDEAMAMAMDEDEFSEEEEEEEHEEVFGEEPAAVCVRERVHAVQLGDSGASATGGPSTSGILCDTVSKPTGFNSAVEGIHFGNRTSLLTAGGLDSNEVRTGASFASRNSLSFAAAAMAGLASASSKGVRAGRDRRSLPSGSSSSSSSAPARLSFFLSGKPLNRLSTIFQAIQRQAIADEDEDDRFTAPDYSSGEGKRLWDEVYNISYQKAESFSEKGSVGASSSSSTPKVIGEVCNMDASNTANYNSKADGSCQQSLLDSILIGELPCDLDKSNSTYSILLLLRVLDGLNRLAPRLHAQVISDAYVEGRITHANEVALGPLIPQEEFLSNKLTPKLARQMQDALALCSGGLPAWCYQLTRSCPFLFPFETRRQYFYSTAFGLSRALQRLQQQQSADNPNPSNDRELRIGRLQRQKVRVSRNRILDSAAKVMELYSSHKAVLEVEYFGEVGTGLGPTLEFYTLLSRDLQKVSLEMWRNSSSVGMRESVSSGDLIMQDADAEILDENVVVPEGNDVSNELLEDGEYVHAPYGLFPRPWPTTSESTRYTKVIAYYCLLGRTMAKALQDGRLLDLPLSTAFYKFMLGQELDLHDIKLLDPELGATLQEMQNLVRRKQFLESSGGSKQVLQTLLFRDTKIEDLCLDFTLPGYPDYVLKPDGQNITVNLETLEEYVNLVVDATVKAGISAQMDAFRSGFNEVFQISTLQIFNEDELDYLLCGCNEMWTAETLAEHIKFDHGYTVASPPIRNLLEIMGEFNSEQQRAFLRFVTGAPKLPSGGLAALNPKLTIVRKHPTGASGAAAVLGTTPPGTSTLGTPLADGDLPSVMTCANYLKLPPYSCKEVMRERLLFAISEGQGSFDLS